MLESRHFRIQASATVQPLKPTTSTTGSDRAGIPRITEWWRMDAAVILMRLFFDQSPGLLGPQHVTERWVGTLWRVMVDVDVGFEGRKTEGW